ncbi:hypothetical protein AVEN_120518-1 [Araneus ventricosus]|uniref:Uncharacterized protein n=1 Tax=Araneus ventricosus TaxID=182803 RepID=A0A4Y2MR60_ARAVE|nr:hypothetical protein AVEN_120518-1 [Araneus ventricosus]
MFILNQSYPDGCFYHTDIIAIQYHCTHGVLPVFLARKCIAHMLCYPSFWLGNALYTRYDSDFCSCGGIGTALHYATECIYTVSWPMRKPAPNFEQEWLKRVANNLVSRHKIRGIIKFMSENRDLFRPP